MPLSWLVMQAGEERYYKTTLNAWSKIYHEEGPAAFFKVIPKAPFPCSALRTH